MPIPQNKEELLEAIQKDFEKLQGEFERIPKNKALEKTMQGHAKGTLMSPLNLIAYLTGWAELVLKWNHHFKNGESPTFPAEGYKWSELGLLAQQFYQDYRQHDLISLIALLEEKVNQILKIIEGSSNEDLYSTKWYKEYTMGRMIQLNTSSPYKNARTRLRSWLKENEK